MSEYGKQNGNNKRQRKKKKSVEGKSRGTTRRYYILTIILRWSVKMKKKGKNKAGGRRVGIKTL